MKTRDILDTYRSLTAQGYSHDAVVALLESRDPPAPSPPTATPPSPKAARRPRRTSVARGSIPRAVLKALPGSIAELTAATGAKGDSVRAAIRRMERHGQVKLVDGQYRRAGEVPATTVRPTAKRTKRGKVNPFNGQPLPAPPTPEASTTGS